MYNDKNVEDLSREKRIKYFLMRAKHRAKEKGVTFTLTCKNITFPDICPVFGIPLKFSNGHYRDDNSPSLDRINMSLGYTPENTIVVSMRANRIRNNGTVEEHLQIVHFYKKLPTAT